MNSTNTDPGEDELPGDPQNSGHLATTELVGQLIALSEIQLREAARNTRPASPCALAEVLLRQRRQREAVFGQHLFADPCWDMLLDLYVSRSKGLRPVSVSSLCIASAVPATTALRWINALVQEGLVARQPDLRDKRRVLVSLTDEGSQKLDILLAKWLEP